MVRRISSFAPRKLLVIDLLSIDNYLDAAACDEIVAAMKSASGGPATVYSRDEVGGVDSRVRRATRLVVPPEIRERVVRQLSERKGEIEEHFGIALNEPEEPHFLRYEAGDFFVAHQDGNTPLIVDQTRHRKISIVIFLNSQSDEPAPGTYGDGALVLHGPYSNLDFRQPLTPAPGTLVAFPAETTHEVVPVTHGERHTIVSWYR